jgi:hypothetical protein
MWGTEKHCPFSAILFRARCDRVREGELHAHQTRSGWRAFKEERYRDLQDLGDVLKAPRADPICTLFIFLDLLECQAKGIPEFLLAHAEHHPTHAHAAANMLV